MSQSFGEFLRYLRRRNGMTQDELATRLGYSRSMIAAIETDRRLADPAAVAAVWVPALDLLEERDLAERLVGLATAARAHAPALAAPYAAYALPATAESSNGAHCMPNSPARVLGRDREVQALCDRFLLQAVRLITLVGPPGVGKTTLALAVGERLQLYFPDGACFVPLAGITDPDRFAATLLEALGVRQRGPSARELLAGHLRHKQILLVLDNFEQILASAPEVAQLLAESAGVRIIVTSRERLHVRAEHLFQVQPLAIDPAVALFLERASTVNPELLLAKIDRRLTERICQRLDCLPLSIELCAAQADFYTFDELLERIAGNHLDALTDGAADMPAWHRSLRDAIQTSYSRLNVEEQEVLQCVSLFVGGAPPAMIESMWPWEHETAAARATHVLRTLATKHLVRIETTALGDRRVMMLDSVREFAQEQLRAAGRQAMLRARHFEAVIDFARLSEQRFWSADFSVWTGRVRLESENIEAALHWAWEEKEHARLFSLLILSWQAWEGSAKRSEFSKWLEKLLPIAHTLGSDVDGMVKNLYCYEASGDRTTQREILAGYQELINACVNPQIKAEMIAACCDLGAIVADWGVALRQAIEYAGSQESSPEFVHFFGYQYSRAFCLPRMLLLYGASLMTHGETNESIQVLERALASSLEAGSLQYAYVQMHLGRAALLRGEEERALLLLEEAAATADQYSDERAQTTAHAFLAEALISLGRLEESKTALARSWRQSALANDPFATQITAIMQTEFALLQGDLEAARHWIRESIALSATSSRDLPWRHIHRAQQAARLAAADGDDRRAAMLYGFRHGYNDTIKIGPHGPVRDNVIAVMAEVRARMGDAAYAEAFDAGACTSLDTMLATLLSAASYDVTPVSQP